MDDERDNDDEIRLNAGTDGNGRRLDHFLARELPEMSRSFLQKLVADGRAAVNGRSAKAAAKLKNGDKITLAVPAPVAFSAEPEDIPLVFLHEDADIAVVDKAPNLVVHPSPGHERGTLVNALAFHCRDLSGVGGVLRPGIVHRLDRDTSGCLVVAKNDRAHQRLMDQFQNRTVGKTYLALTAAPPRPTAGRVEGRIGRHPHDPRRMSVLTRGGREALTEYRLRETFGAVCLVECELHTGRTHQIRVHLRQVGAPILCDADYGGARPFTRADAVRSVAELGRRRDAATLAARRVADGAALNRGEYKAVCRALAAAATPPSPSSMASSLPSADPSADGGGDAEILLARQGLHAWRLSFTHPTTGERLSFEAPLPPDMAAALATLRRLRDSGENR